MSEWDPTQYQALTEGELLEGEPLTEDLLTRMGSDVEYLRAQQLLTQNAWTLGSDVWDHFADAPGTTNSVGRVTAKSSGVTHNAAKHYVRLEATGAEADGGFIRGPHARTPDEVPTIIEARIYGSAHDTNNRPLMGFAPSAAAAVQGTPGTTWALFMRGTNANTWKAQTGSSSTAQTTTDNIAGNFISWDLLRVEYRVGEVKFYLNDVLVATHTTNIVSSVALEAFVKAATGTGAAYVFADLMSVRAIANSLSSHSGAT